MSAHDGAQSVPYAFEDDDTCANALDYGRRRDWVRPPSEPIRQARPSPVGTVYFIGPKRGVVKIGFTTNLSARLARLQAMSPVRLAVLAIIENEPIATERRYHYQFSKYRRHGEWFVRSPEIDEEIRRLKS